MKKRNLFVAWLFAKGVIVSLLFVLLGFNYLLSIKKFWYDTRYSVSDMQRYIRNKKNIDEFNEEGYTALMMASASGNKDVVNLLIKNGANVNLQAKNAVGDTALHIACQNGKAEVIDVLIDNYANPVAKNKNGQVPLFKIVTTEDPVIFRKVVQKFTDEGYDINYPSKSGLSLLFAVVEERKAPLLKILQDYFGHLVNFELKTTNGKTIRQFASEKVDKISDLLKDLKPKILSRLYAGINVNAYYKKFSFNNDFNVTQVAAIKGKGAYLESAIKNYRANINLKDKRLGNTPLNWACLYNWPKVVEIILKNKPIITAKNKRGYEPIHCLWGIREEGNREKVAKELFNQGANFNAQDNSGNTFLHRAVLLRDYDMIKLIAQNRYFNHRVNFHLKNKHEQTAMDIAKKYKDKDIISLLKNNYNITYLDRTDKKEKITPLMIAAMRGDMFAAKKLLRQTRTLKNINAKTINQNTALSLAIQCRNIDVAQLLLKEKNIKVNIKNKEGKTPFDLARELGKKEDNSEMIKTFLKDFLSALKKSEKNY